MREIGFLDVRAVKRSKITIGNPEIAKLLGEINFSSITYRAFKLKGLEDICENYGQKLIYNGGITDNEE